MGRGPLFPFFIHFGHGVVKSSDLRSSTRRFSLGLQDELKLSKFELIPIGELPHMESLAAILGCRVSFFPVPYFVQTLGSCFKVEADWGGVPERWAVVLKKTGGGQVWCYLGRLGVGGSFLSSMERVVARNSIGMTRRRRCPQYWKLDQLVASQDLLYGLHGVGQGDDSLRWRGREKRRFKVRSLPQAQ
ncbi:hypothetical protein Acr_25g0001100 [Actinidia rufa]|uniref:Uncharacterized protein n=1 Tax=Actinidia rufa TaxID=165716 RepID=A0A7J0GY58_9ERIC|nr:hypothetical protein Acr_25g0001100 [Actinidia rufa]